LFALDLASSLSLVRPALAQGEIRIGVIDTFLPHRIKLG